MNNSKALNMSQAFSYPLFFSLVFWIRYIFFYGFFISLIVLILNSILHFKLFKNLHKVADMLHSTSLFKYHTKNSIYDVLIIQWTIHSAVIWKMSTWCELDIENSKSENKGVGYSKICTISKVQGQKIESYSFAFYFYSHVQSIIYIFI